MDTAIFARKKHDSPCFVIQCLRVISCNNLAFVVALGIVNDIIQKTYVSLVALVNCAQNVKIPLISVRISRAQPIIQGRELTS